MTKKELPSSVFPKCPLLNRPHSKHCNCDHRERTNIISIVVQSQFYPICAKSRAGNSSCRTRSGAGGEVKWQFLPAAENGLKIASTKRVGRRRVLDRRQ
jgi:hypothetical protein